MGVCPFDALLGAAGHQSTWGSDSGSRTSLAGIWAKDPPVDRRSSLAIPVGPSLGRCPPMGLGWVP